uniref:Rpl19 n=1 Tax=Arundo donax TaxID=35708 RepID=A0A0A9F1B7_ARUDO
MPTPAPKPENRSPRQSLSLPQLTPRRWRPRGLSQWRRRKRKHTSHHRRASQRSSSAKSSGF